MQEQYIHHPFQSTLYSTRTPGRAPHTHHWALPPSSPTPFPHAAVVKLGSQYLSAKPLIPVFISRAFTGVRIRIPVCGAELRQLLTNRLIGRYHPAGAVGD